MQPHVGKFFFFSLFFDLLIKLNFLNIFSVGLLDVMCKSIFNNQLWKSFDSPTLPPQKKNQTFLLQMWGLDH